MEMLRRLQAERPLVFWLVLLVGFWVAFRLLIFVAELILGPFGLPGWAPLALVLVGLVVVARRQDSR
ncbi:hypothetical protein [Klenkia soli]|nr:hypothetical protein [Klenkia soli]